MKKSHLFVKLAWSTLLAVYLVILAGSVVRSSGSGMGCPDWPKCFGQWIPPTDVSQLPEGYEARFLEGRKEKLDKYIRLIESIGFGVIAEQMRNDPSLIESEPFDARGTWTEYVNRLFGFLSGNFMLVLFILSLFWWRKDYWIPIISLVSLLALVFQAWLGAVVVASNLLPWIISIHMIGAFLIIGLLLLLIARVGEIKAYPSIQSRQLLAIALILTLVQVVLGTQVRQEIDHVARAIGDRSMWIDQLGLQFKIHRSFTLLLIAINVLFIWKNRHVLNQRSIRLYLGLFALEIVIGIILAYASMPVWAQPAHLLLSTLFFGYQCYLWAGSKEKAQRRIPLGS